MIYNIEVKILHAFELEGDNLDDVKDKVKNLMFDEHNIDNLTDDEITLITDDKGRQVWPRMDIQGVCVNCGHEDLDYSESILEGNGIGFPWECSECGAKGTEWYDMEFNSHIIK